MWISLAKDFDLQVEARIHRILFVHMDCFEPNAEVRVPSGIMACQETCLYTKPVRRHEVYNIPSVVPHSPLH